ncbi:uncharacterized protein DUF4239 [Stackebrandtia albiflava]|uniref:Uncharacterized protein DUF4239 n=1 Tax=Stackebrandtia albiflava TaxID=406432 RepID=A0A562VA51_9ACTN|nr:DUF4239 domain-containing protein [Stackebrandtia albiflava]TWJ14752.1 uncharacterized protein DUF4239 [Stackebrandtia albiflava]
MNPLILGLLIVVVVAAVAGGTAVLQQRFSPPQNREGYNEVAGSVFEIVSVLYAIVLAFVLIAVWEQMQDAQAMTYEESGALVDVYWAAQDLPDENRQAVEALCLEYANWVIEEEWPAMATQRDTGLDGWEMIDEMRGQFNQAIDVTDQTSLGLSQDAEETIAVLSQSRTDRLNTAQSGLSAVMWLVLIAGALLMFGILLLFGVPGRLAHVIVVVIAAAMVALLLFSVYELEYPFARGVAVEADAFRLALERMSHVR